MDSVRTDRLHPMDPKQTVLFGLFSLGLLPLVRFFQAGASYDAALGRGDRFRTLFLLWLGSGLLGNLTAPLGVGLLVLIGTVVLGYVLLRHALAAREEIARRLGGAELRPSSTYYLLMTFAPLLAPFLVGFVLLGWQAFLFFEDHGRVVAAAGRAGASPEPLPLLGDSDPFVAHHQAQRG